ncbi:hypothetical protein [Thauera sp.]|uniref:hypothetical protein n=1 Tax=Thauera sp. TaxID=1905334 RepID=UPI002A366D17|nr:hypothetical protein [Thauera sp.]MDX9886608.1 hypothetical protein [Thauera sp.]
MSRLRQRAAPAEERDEHTMPDAAGPMPEGAKKGKLPDFLQVLRAAPQPDPFASSPMCLNPFAVSRSTLSQLGWLLSGHGG